MLTELPVKTGAVRRDERVSRKTRSYPSTSPLGGTKTERKKWKRRRVERNKNRWRLVDGGKVQMVPACQRSFLGLGLRSNSGKAPWAFMGFHPGTQCNVLNKRRHQGEGLIANFFSRLQDWSKMKGASVRKLNGFKFAWRRREGKMHPVFLAFESRWNERL